MVTFRVSDMTCGHCASAIARAVAEVDRNARIEVSIPDELVRVAGGLSEEDVAEAIRLAGYTPQAVSAPAAQASAMGGCCCAARKGRAATT